MRYLMRRMVFPSGGGTGRCPIWDEKGRDAFFVGHRVPPIPHPVGGGERVSFLDSHGRELAFIRRATLPHLGPALVLYYADEVQAVVCPARFDPTRCPLAADAPDDLHACGDLPGLEYTFTRDGRTVAAVSGSCFRPADDRGAGYGVDVSRGEDDLLILAGTVLIDLCCGCREAGQAGGARDVPGTAGPAFARARAVPYPRAKARARPSARSA